MFRYTSPELLTGMILFSGYLVALSVLHVLGVLLDRQSIEDGLFWILLGPISFSVQMTVELRVQDEVVQFLASVGHFCVIAVVILSSRPKRVTH